MQRIYSLPLLVTMWAKPITSVSNGVKRIKGIEAHTEPSQILDMIGE